MLSWNAFYLHYKRISLLVKPSHFLDSSNNSHSRRLYHKVYVKFHIIPQFCWWMWILNMATNDFPSVPYSDPPVFSDLALTLKTNTYISSTSTSIRWSIVNFQNFQIHNFFLFLLIESIPNFNRVVNGQFPKASGVVDGRLDSERCTIVDPQWTPINVSFIHFWKQNGQFVSFKLRPKETQLAKSPNIYTLIWGVGVLMWRVGGWYSGLMYSILSLFFGIMTAFLKQQKL